MPDPTPIRTIHDACPIWYDVCCCEPEPRWQRLAEELEAEEAEKKAKQEKAKERRTETGS